MKAIIEPVAIRAKDAAELLGCSRRQVQLMAQRGILPHRRLGKLLLFSPRALREWIDSGGDTPIDIDTPNGVD